MAQQSVTYGNPFAQDTGRGPSASIWGSCPILALKENFGGDLSGVGSYFEDDFQYTPAVVTLNGQGTYGQGWSTFFDTSGIAGSLADTTNLPLEGGVLGLKHGTTAKQMIMHAQGGGFGFVDASSTSGKFRGKMWFECSLAISSLATTNNKVFVGLAGCDAGASTPTAANGNLLAAAGVDGMMYTNSFFGFFKPTASPLVNNANCQLNGGTAATGKTITGTLLNDFAVCYASLGGASIQFPGTSSNLLNLMANTGVTGSLVAPTFTTGNFTNTTTMKVKLGWIFDPTPGCIQLNSASAINTTQTVGTTYRAIITFYVNGQRSGAFLIPTDVQATVFPSVWMGPAIAIGYGAGAAGVLYVDWIRCAQLGTY